MKDRESSYQLKKEETVAHHLPPAWCGSICRNAMNEICIEQCAVDKDCSGFDLKPNLKLEDMPRFPLKVSADMTKEEKFTSVTIYLAKVVDHLKGVENGQPYHPVPRPNPYRSRSSQLPENLKGEDLLHDIAETITPSSDREERESQGIRSNEVVGRDD